MDNSHLAGGALPPFPLSPNVDVMTAVHGEDGEHELRTPPPLPPRTYIIPSSSILPSTIAIESDGEDELIDSAHPPPLPPRNYSRLSVQDQIPLSPMAAVQSPALPPRRAIVVDQSNEIRVPEEDSQFLQPVRRDDAPTVETGSNTVPYPDPSEFASPVLVDLQPPPAGIHSVFLPPDPTSAETVQPIPNPRTPSPLVSPPTVLNSLPSLPQLPKTSLPLPTLYTFICLFAPLLIAYFGFGLIWIILTGVASWWVWADHERWQTRRMVDDPEKDRMKGKVRGDRLLNEETVEWMNHILESLFPLISTDLLTPFIDLLEDALIQQVPPIVSSVRLTSPSLGKEPIRIVSMRPMSDAEWFENVSSAPTAPTNPSSLSQNNTPLSSTAPRTSHLRTSSTFSRFSQSSSHRPANLDVDQEVRKDEVRDRRRRDRILRKIGGRRVQGDGKPNEKVETHWNDSTVPLDDTPGTSPNGTGSFPRADSENEQQEDDDDESGQYVNLAVDFSFDGGRKNKDGRTLHFLAYFGVGLKGVGGAEMPIWVEMLKITGTVHLRILLSPTTPFVRTATFSLPSLPEFDFAAKPIKDVSLDFMGLPAIRPFINKSIKQVADAFLKPNSYTMDLDRLLLGQEASLRTQSVGALHIRIHRASNIVSSDTFGKSDPYCVISFAKFNKPLFSTRTIVKTLDPRWEEDSFLLITADMIESGERLRLTLYDSDRFSSDDSMGMVEFELADLLDENTRTEGAEAGLARRVDELIPVRTGMKVSGSLTWSYQFYPLWKMSQDSERSHEIADELWNSEKHGDNDIGAGREGSVINNGLIYRLLGRMQPEALPWQAERQQRRLESIAWLTGERARETLEATEKPSPDRRSGILQFTITQCTDLELEKSKGTFSKGLKKDHRGAAGGSPALEDVIHSAAWESSKPPSAYCEVILNGRLIYRTRTKQLNPSPYFNAVSERFIRDWTRARLVVVVRDERDREHDPVLGIVAMNLAAVLHHGCQVTRNFPLVGGLGWGILRMSLLFKAVDVQLPKGISGFEIASIKLHDIRVRKPDGWDSSRLKMAITTDSDERELTWLPKENRRQSISSVRTNVNSPRSAASRVSFAEDDMLQWQFQDDVERTLAISYRHSCSLVVRFFYDNGKLKKDTTLAMGLLRLSAVPEGGQVQHRQIAVYDTDDFTLAYDMALDREESLAKKEIDSHPHLTLLDLSCTLLPGLSRAHEKLTKRDKRMARVYEAWTLAQDVGTKGDYQAASSRGKQVNAMVGGGKDREGGGLDEDEDSLLSSGDEDTNDDVDGIMNFPPPNDIYNNDLDDPTDQAYDPTETENKQQSAYNKWRTQTQALHRHHKGIMQNKFARTLKFGKDKVQEKLVMVNNKSPLGSGRERRAQGAVMEVEMEGQSSL